jgi:hypothetical protein
MREQAQAAADIATRYEKRVVAYRAAIIAALIPS